MVEMECQRWATLALGVGMAMVTGCNQAPESSGLTAGDTSGVDSATTDATSDTGATGSTSDGLTTSGDDTPPAPKYDVGGIPDVPPPIGGCNGGGDGPAYSYIWIANSGESTVSKINTVTLEEEGRYLTDPSGNGNPSRTSVNLNGDVAIANRNGGLVKFYANPAHCVDRNGNGSIETSSGSNDVLAWDAEECRAWHTPFDYGSQRPVAWTAGEWNAGACRYDNAMVWTSGTNDNFQGGEPWPCEDPEQDPDQCQKGEPKPQPKGSGVDVILVDGEDGAVVELVNIPEVIADYYGIYGGAVDAAGNFWGSQLGQGDLVRVNLDDFSYSVYPMATSGYGMTVDSKGYVWTCSYEVGRFDPDTETWQTATPGGSGGCMEDGNGTLWLATAGLVGVDIDTLQVVKNIPLGGGGGGGIDPGGQGEGGYVHGVSIDFQGYVWGVSMGNVAYRVDPDTEDYDTVTGLNYPYTYSDMTGFALANAGGWSPAG